MKWPELSVHSSRSRRARLAYPLLCVLLSGVAVVAAATPAFAAPPAAPAQPTVAALNAAIVVTFAPPSNGGSPITSYTVTCTSSNGGATGTMTGVSSPTLVSALTNGRTYTCTVFATNVDGDGPPSVASAAAVPNTVPDAPAQPSLVALNASFLVMFTPPFDGGSAITSYKATCTSSNGGATGSSTGVSSPIVVSGLTNAKTYTCTVFATNVDGNGPASVASAAGIPNTVPDAPAQPTVIGLGTSVIVTFTAPFNGGSAITGYTASCTSSDGGAPGTTSDVVSPITVTGLTTNKTYQCTVLASNVNGNGPASVPSVAVLLNALPSAPVQPTVVGLIGSIEVSFVPPFDGGSPLTKFTAACTSSDGGAAGLGVDVSSPVTVSSLTAGKTYTCTVFASNANGDGPASVASAPVTLIAVPDAPAPPSLTPGTASVIVAFTPPSSDGGSPITGYTAACVSSDGGTPGSATGTASPIVVHALSSSKTYTCTVFASNANGNGAVSPASAPVVTLEAVPDPPAAPTVVAGDGNITVGFVAPADGGSPITSYSATCTSSDGGATGTATGTTSPLLVNLLTNGNTYTCTVFATNANGDGLPSAPSVTAVPNAVPGAPAPPSVLAGTTSIRVTFVPPFSGGSAIISFTASCDSTNGGASGLVSGSASPITVAPLTPGKTYTCRVYATNANGAGPFSVPSPVIVIMTEPSQPSAPSVTSGNGAVTVSFHAPSNGGAAITSYQARCTSTNGGAGHTTAGKGLAIAVTGLSNGYTYRCVVWATNSHGTSPTSSQSPAVVPYGRGYRMFSGDGGIFTFGSSGYYGSAVGHARALVISMITTRDNKGYWLISQAGEVFNFGDAKFYGSMAGAHLNRPIVGAAATPSGRGYWLVASDGGIFSFGDAHFYGSTGNIKLNQAIVGMTATATGRGYWFVAADGGLFSFGDARFHGSASGRSLQPIIGMATSATGNGYWIATFTGQVLAFGDAPSFRSGAIPGLRVPIVGIAASPTSKGYWLSDAAGGVFSFGDADYFRWPGPLTLRRRIRGISR